MSMKTVQSPTHLPALQEMGVRNANEIVGYTLRPDGSRNDRLKIKYKRAKGSLLPYSRTYKFGRSLKTVIADGGTSRMEHTYEISPFLLQAVAELDTLVADNKKIGGEAKSVIGEELVSDLLEECAEIEKLVSVKADAIDAVAVAARLNRLKAQIASL